MDFIRRRILVSIIAFIAVLHLDFILPRLVPGSAAEIFASGTKLPSVAVKLIEARLGLDQPLYIQYFLYLKGIFATWPPYFGVSYQYYPATVSSLIAQKLPWTILLIASALILSSVISFILAGITSLRRGSSVEFGSVYASIVFWATPAFWIGMILIFTFGITLGVLPISGNVGFNVTSGPDYFYSVFVHAILPIITLTAVIFGQNYILLRGAVQEVLKTDYVVAAKIRGLPNSVIQFGYIVRNSLLPIVPLLGYSVASLISASVLVESVFGYSGLGDLIVDAIVNRDYPVLEGAFFYVTIIVIVGSLIGDLLILRLDPRLRQQ
ncbi:MAG TPA: ABC transporter permease [Nitrososphaerales archaeon]|nr:ABC transporter permease [Nitrososphaerales archaeon]